MKRWVVVAVVALLLIPSDGAVASAGVPGTPGGPGVPPAPGASGVPGGPPAAASPRAPAVPAAGYRWPLAGTPEVTRPFDPPPRPWLPGHRGVDLGAVPGALVLAAGQGVVAFAGSVAGTGVVSIDHPGGLRTTYEPVTPLVSAGAQVAGGQPVGILVPGHEGCPVSACLHWGLRRGADYLDPLLLLRAARMRLYPLPGRAA